MNSPLSRETALSLHQRMLRIRLVEETLAAEYPKEEMKCPMHLYIGQEGIAAGVSEALNPGDGVISTHRSHGHYLAKQGNLPTFFAELFGRSTGSSGGKGGSMHLLDLDVGYLGSSAIVGGNIPMVAGLALAYQYRQERRVAVAYFGDGAAEEGVLFETLNFAALKRLPILFVCENNHFSVLTRLEERQPADNIFLKAREFGLPTERLDGNDVGEVYRAAQAACDSIREGRGPVFLEAKTYRWRTHCGPQWDAPQAARPAGELAAWMKRCPISLHRQYLQAHLGVRDEVLSSLEAGLQAEIAQALAFARASPFPHADRLREDVLA